jgi:hypothetical protein
MHAENQRRIECDRTSVTCDGIDKPDRIADQYQPIGSPAGCDPRHGSRSICGACRGGTLESGLQRWKAGRQGRDAGPSDCVQIFERN